MAPAAPKDAVFAAALAVLDTELAIFASVLKIFVIPVRASVILPSIPTPACPVGSIIEVGLLPQYVYRCCVHGSYGFPLYVSCVRNRPVEG